MSSSVQSLLHNFDSLSQPEKHEAAVEILKRSMADDFAELADGALLELADEMFQKLDKDEAASRSIGS